MHRQKEYIKDLGEYHDLYLKSDESLLSNVFENFRKMCLEIYELALANLFQPPA